MTQVRLTLDSKGEGDLTSDSDGSILVDDGIETVVQISLFTDAPASADDGIQNQEDRRGFWDDVYEDDPTPIGSKRWLWLRKTITDESLRGLESATKDALQWMVDEGAASSIEHSAMRDAYQQEVVREVLTIYGPTGDLLYQDTWETFFAIQ